jgi:hypothetical protein
MLLDESLVMAPLMHWLLITFVLDHQNILIFFTEMIKAKVDAANKQLMAEFESERSHHQRIHI